MANMYMIHTCPQRLDYVQGILVPDMMAQGIKRDYIIVALDDKQEGNLKAFLSALEMLPKTGFAWHLQDDVVISSYFADQTEKEYKTDVICGYCCQTDPWICGKVSPSYAWFSFQCIGYSNEIAKEFLAWFEEKGKEQHPDWVNYNKFDDSFFHEFIKEKNYRAYNMRPNIVEHIDYLLGGSIVNEERSWQSQAFYWVEPERVEDVKKRLSNS